MKCWVIFSKYSGDCIEEPRVKHVVVTDLVLKVAHLFYHQLLLSVNCASSVALTTVDTEKMEQEVGTRTRNQNRKSLFWFPRIRDQVPGRTGQRAAKLLSG